ncbi:hypothetical protein NDU88_005671 [Pleurodeles waltl]|uniref:Uncharacterized protein n=1 Tax=Pleurodeles waltl TaxID=8319 RepID=A0AAV7SMF9_PLEWA|nr:hypothetical protein NDU88_005671 [Pleurodeles waltl]
MLKGATGKDKDWYVVQTVVRRGGCLDDPLGRGPDCGVNQEKSTPSLWEGSEEHTVSPEEVPWTCSPCPCGASALCDVCEWSTLGGSFWATPAGAGSIDCSARRFR